MDKFKPQSPDPHLKEEVMHKDHWIEHSLKLEYIINLCIFV